MKMILTILTLGVLVFINCNSILAQVPIKWVKIAEQIWMTENLNVDRFQNGDLIPEAKTNDEWEKAGDKGEPAWCYYENDPENGEKYGKLYNWFAVKDKRGLAPEGWHIPTEAEFKRLISAVRNGNALKAIDQGMEIGVGTNTSGFSALLAGYRNYNSTFLFLGGNTHFWSSTGDSTSYACSMFLVKNNNIYFDYINLESGFSVRCVKD